MSVRKDIEEMKKKIADMEQQEEEPKFKMPKKWKGTLKKSSKKKNQRKMLFIYLRRNGRVEGPILKDYSDNVLTHEFKGYDIDPRAIWDWDRHKVYIVKEIDRRPVSNLNYREILRRGDSTESDEILLKATMKAMMQVAKKSMNKIAMIIVGLIIVGALIFFFAKG